MNSEIDVELLAHRRPDYVTESIALNAADVAWRDEIVEWGRVGDSAVGYEFLTITPESLNTWLRTVASDGIERRHIIDAGAFFGNDIARAAVAGQFASATAITLIEMPEHEQLEGVDMVYGNLAEPRTYDTIEPADLIVSQMTLHNTVDQLAIIELLADELALDGTLIAQYHAGIEPVMKPDVLTQILESAGLDVHDIRSDERWWQGDLYEVNATRRVASPIRFASVEYVAEGDAVVFQETPFYQLAHPL